MDNDISHRPDCLPSYFGPTGFHWLDQGRLAGCARPGLVRKMDMDLTLLYRVGVRSLVSLTEEWVPDPAEMARHGIHVRYFPIPDRMPPTINQAVEMCKSSNSFLDQGKPVAYHCRAGKGRTGTMLAAHRIWEGHTAETAISGVQQINKYWIESEAQESFLHEFDAFLRNN